MPDGGEVLIFDSWRSRYDTMSYQDQRNFYNDVARLYPDQKRYCLKSSLEFFSRIDHPVAVAELGGWDGAMAREVMAADPHVTGWINYEISSEAVQRSMGNDMPSGYIACVLDDFLWNSSIDLGSVNVFVATHVIEHLRESDVRRLVQTLARERVKHAYIEAPIREDDVGRDWSGYQGTHILEVGWKQVSEIFVEAGYLTTDRLYGECARGFALRE